MKFFGGQITFGTNCGSKKMLVPLDYGSKEVFGPKKFVVLIKFWFRIMSGQNNFPEIFWTIATRTNVACANVCVTGLRPKTLILPYNGDQVRMWGMGVHGG